MPKKLVVEGKGRMPARAVEESRRIGKLLAAYVDDSGVSSREIEREVGWGNGSLGRILDGERALRFSHVIAVLDAIGIPAGKFFAAAFPRTEEAQQAAREDEIVPGLSRERLWAEIQHAVERTVPKKKQAAARRKKQPAKRGVR